MSPARGRTRSRGLRQLSDEELIANAGTGDALAFEVLFDRHAGAAFSLAYRMCGRAVLAEDVIQEAFLSVWRIGMRYDGSKGSVRAWLLGAVRHKAIDVLRRETARAGREVHDEIAAEQVPARDRTDGEVERREAAGQVRCALSELPGEQRRVIELAYFGGFTHTQIAGLLELPAGTVKGRMRLGLKKLGALIAEPAPVASEWSGARR
ncbi:MAG TPA: sigma-70 family RNA polymerase sigma factor [Solirubrobacteraceae bacterium]|nr:sigma-70 family RNA polymerase sigma factor [Solirubrobacteraceae bacterium]